METEQPNQPAATVTPQHTPKKSKINGKKLLMWLVLLLVIAGAAYAGYYYRDQQAKDDAKVTTAEIAALTAKNTQLKKDLAAAKVTTAAATAPSAEDLANIKAAIESGNTAALEQMIANPVTVILAASEGLGERTPTQAVADLAYLDGATDPWNFALAATTLGGYQTGDYAKYFPTTALVGKSANNYVVSFSFDNDGNISTIFMANSADLL